MRPSGRAPTAILATRVRSLGSSKPRRRKRGPTPPVSSANSLTLIGRAPRRRPSTISSDPPSIAHLKLRLWLCYTCIARFPMLAIRLPQSIEKRLEKLARRTGRTKTFYVRQAILEHLDDLEDLYQAERTLNRIRSGDEQTIPLGDALKRHGLED